MTRKIKCVQMVLFETEKSVFYIHIFFQVGSCQRAAVLRPFITKDFMTGLAAIPGEHIPIDVVNKMAEDVSEVGEKFSIFMK